jgi:membrane protein YdbS with pleckstrin-like domain
MTEGKKKPEITLEEYLKRIRPLFIMIMFLPLSGMVAAMVILYMIQPKNLILVEALIFLSMLFFVVSVYLLYKRMGTLQPKPKPVETPAN